MRLIVPYVATGRRWDKIRAEKAIAGFFLLNMMYAPGMYF
jgi:hypothetical protein